MKRFVIKMLSYYMMTKKKEKNIAEFNNRL